MPKPSWLDELESRISKLRGVQQLSIPVNHAETLTKIVRASLDRELYACKLCDWTHHQHVREALRTAGLLGDPDAEA